MLKNNLKQSNFIISKKEGSLFSITNQADKVYQIDERVLDLTVSQIDKKVKIPKSDWNYKLPADLYVGLVILFENIEPAIYLIPSKVFSDPDNYIFFNNSQSERFKHLSNWATEGSGTQIKNKVA